MKNRPDRPWYVTLLCVLLLAGAGAELALFFMAVYGVENEFTGVISKGTYLLAFVLSLVCGIFMLRGVNWARMLFYTGFPGICLWSYICLVVQHPLATPYVAVRMVELVAFCIALSMERANFFFTGRNSFFRRSRDARRDYSSGKYNY